MTDGTPIPVVVQGLGGLGRAAITVCAHTPAVDLVGVITRRPDQASGPPVGVSVHSTAQEAASAHPGAIVVSTVHALGGDLAQALAEVARTGLDVVTSSGMFHPLSEPAAAVALLDETARRHGVRVVAAGVQPGFVFDVLPATLLDLVPGWRRLDLVKPSDARAWPSTTRHVLGLGEAPEVLESATPYPLAASAHLLADAVGGSIETLDEGRTALTLDRDLVLPDETIPAGRAVGYVHRCAARLHDGREIRIQWRPILDVTAATDLSLGLRVTGTEDLAADLVMHLDGSFRQDPYPATAARMLHTAVRARDLPPGLHTVMGAGLAWPTPL